MAEVVVKFEQLTEKPKNKINSSIHQPSQHPIHSTIQHIGVNEWRKKIDLVQKQIQKKQDFLIRDLDFSDRHLLDQGIQKNSEQLAAIRSDIKVEIVRLKTRQDTKTELLDILLHEESTDDFTGLRREISEIQVSIDELAKM